MTHTTETHSIAIAAEQRITAPTESDVSLIVNRYRMWAPDVQRVLRIPPIAAFIRKLGKRPAVAPFSSVLILDPRE